MAAASSKAEFAATCAALGIRYIVVGSHWPPVAEESVRSKDYRLAFFLLTALPASLVVLDAALWIERPIDAISRETRALSTTPSFSYEIVRQRFDARGGTC
jgi:hypothetical protein